ncbi:alpha-soluble NSF attachment protein 2 isoform X2 [Beta vulgaris subsp. vulgaris]|uniref:alpha-soluble NSF attachment protein 2 isoform X2 n=1 Tax=Beta vulgaris subsp. vulgaris TaxID=3555 RepID=UPI002036F1CE|nr:alpha-soluble NSF attachment protein 2 isoform X2 [Beta vulgaris subsp. vulgaris]
MLPNCSKKLPILTNSLNHAGAAYLKLANCYLKVESRHEAANAYAEAGHAYKKTSSKEAVSCLEQAVNSFLEIGRLNMAARYCKEIGDIFETEENLEQAIVWYDKAADLFQSEEVTTSANQNRQKVAQYSAQLEQYPKAIEIYEDIARQSINNSLLKYGVKGHLLNAGLCHLCKGDVVSINNALDKYQDLDPTFVGTREYKFLNGLASAIDEQDVAKFTDLVKEFDSMTPLDAWKTTLLLRVKEKLKAQDEDDDDLT